ncbi:MAG: hypothetical protein J0M24_14830 [Verrucomicrobia bacterium]|nr:hypothetical protein [Verrucomicrobiota bacterium]
MKKLSYLLISLTFTFACVSLWAMLTAVAKLSPHWSQTLPAFTRLCLDLSPWLLALPIPVVAFCVFALVRRNERQGQEWGLTFLAGSMTTLCLIFFPVLLAVLLPVFQSLEGK